ncbi:peptidoglycan-binding protein [Streptomyces triculaminicus]|uniref:peptidoglycan-binding protein n=1 Tax=Streptomyces triculaminicus TaxID=2816232 RepID=UPI0033EC6EFD
MRVEDTFYVVVTGDTLFKIATRFNTTVEQLQAWNHIPDPNHIEVGQQLLVAKSPSGFVPFPGAAWFKAKPNHPIISLMAVRLVEEGCSAYGPNGGQTQWDDEDRRSYSLWQQKLGFKGADADGWPGEKSWDKLQVPFPQFE